MSLFGDDFDNSESTQAPEHVAYVALGSNVGDGVKQLRLAIAALAALPSTVSLASSSFYRSSPCVPGESDAATNQEKWGGDYTNAVVKLMTTLQPLELLYELQCIELAAGRTRSYRNAPRTLDLDLLLYDELQCQDDALILPHPRMYERAFVLYPLQEIAPKKVSAQDLDQIRFQSKPIKLTRN